MATAQTQRRTPTADEILETLYADENARIHLNPRTNRRACILNGHGDIWVMGLGRSGYCLLLVLDWDDPDLVDKLQAILDQN